ncbi:MAG: restriction endonuclease, SacI family [Firmicutes bacterium]|nr:restriction endonuclease, SacI family [Bacillota bacterium]
MNNQPFFRYDRIDGMERVHSRARESYQFLVETVRLANTLSEKQALVALAALIRERMKTAVPQGLVVLPGLTVDGVCDAVTTFLSESAEEGKRAQAVVTAILQVVYDDVRTSRVNDPSRHIPGDCNVMINAQSVMAVEVRAKPVIGGEPLDFARRLQEAGIERGMVVALAHNQGTLDVHHESREALLRHGVLLEVRTDVRRLIHDSLMWSRFSLAEALARLPNLIRQELSRIEVHANTLLRWDELCKLQNRS